MQDFKYSITYKISILTSINFISNLKSTSPKPIQFYAYYWGRFKLNLIQQKEDYFFFAEAASNSLEFRVSIKDEKVYLHEAGVIPLLLTDKIEALFQNKKEFTQGILYDNRPSLEDLYTEEQMYKTTFKDPEDFEEVKAYQNLIEGIDRHFNNLLGIQSVSAMEKESTKTITLSTHMAQHEIKIHKELFDMEAIRGVNRMLQDLGHEKTLHLTIDPQMYMVILHLTEKELEFANRIGLIV